MHQQPRIPEPAHGIQVNFCKNPQCPNFGVPASPHRQPRGRSTAETPRDTYTIVGRSNRRGFARPRLQCTLCGEKPPLKSNRAIAEELSRFSGYLLPKTISCPSETCANHTVDMAATHGAYRAFGTTKSGSHRYQCTRCATTFSVGRSTLRQRKPHKNIQVFRLLVNKMPLKRICEAADLSMPSLYDKIAFLHRQCLAFAGSREHQLLEGMPLRRLYLGVDRQDYLINWTYARDKRNVALSAVGSADNTTGYVFGLHLNFDPSLDHELVEREANALGDYERTHPFRQYARLWLQGDYTHARETRERTRSHASSQSLEDSIASTYQDAIDRKDVEQAESLDATITLPATGMQVHEEYTLYGHFVFLKQLLGGVEKLRFFLDQESGIRAACLAAFTQQITHGQCDAFYVRINNDLTIDARKRALATSRRVWNALKAAHPDLSDSALKLFLLKERMSEVKVFGAWQDRWIAHPFPNMSEPEKAVCYLTDTGQYDEDHLAWLYNKASLHAIDRFFMQVRRRLSLLERAISTPSRAGRRWHGYSPYNPAIIATVLDIFRVFYNFVEVGKDTQTPAMRLGLAKGVVTMEDIMYYA